MKTTHKIINYVFTQREKYFKNIYEILNLKKDCVEICLDNRKNRK